MTKTQNLAKRISGEPLIVDKERLSNWWHRTYASGAKCGKRIVRPAPGIPSGLTYFNVRVKVANPDNDRRSYFEDIGPVAKQALDSGFGLFLDRQIYLVNGELYERVPVRPQWRDDPPRYELRALLSDTVPQTFDPEQVGVSSF